MMTVKDPHPNGFWLGRQDCFFLCFSDGSLDYLEYDPVDGNSLSQPFNWDEHSITAGVSGPQPNTRLNPEDTSDNAVHLAIHEISRVQEGADWSKIRVIYDVPNSFRRLGYRCSLTVYGVEPGVAEDSNYHDDKLQCLDNVKSDLPGGWLQRQEFYCTVSASEINSEPFAAYEKAELLCRQTAATGEVVRRSAGEKRWIPRESQLVPLDHQWIT